jgi:prepilin-type processing-associated H-X9-DG protein/prepilin-type N-terminal cleavage/methylation domain-containing protein
MFGNDLSVPQRVIAGHRTVCKREVTSGLGYARSRRAFTLIELLLVIAIVAILMSLLLAALSQGKSQARSTVCKSNLRQIGFAMTMYLADFSEYPRGTGGADWERLLAAYSTDVLRELEAYNQKGRYRNPSFRNRFWICPEVEVGSADGHGLIYDDVLRMKIVEKENVVSVYGLNDYGTMSPAGRTLMGLWKDGRGARESDIAVPSDLIGVGDIRVVGHNMGPRHQIRWPSKRHRGGANVLFCDGHVEFGKQEHLIRNSAPALRRWNRTHEAEPTIDSSMSPIIPPTLRPQ